MPYPTIHLSAPILSVDVSVGTDAEILRKLQSVPRLPLIVARRIVALRPYRDHADMVQRVNDAAQLPKERIGPKVAAFLIVGESHNFLIVRRSQPIVTRGSQACF